jgi:hypothetical protein
MERDDEKCFWDIAVLKEEMRNVLAITWLMKKSNEKCFRNPVLRQDVV